MFVKDIRGREERPPVLSGIIQGSGKTRMRPGPERSGLEANSIEQFRRSHS